MNEYEGEVGVAVVVGRFCIDREYQSSARLRGWLDGGCVVGHDKTGAKERRPKQISTSLAQWRCDERCAQQSNPDLRCAERLQIASGSLSSGGALRRPVGSQ